VNRLEEVRDFVRSVDGDLQRTFPFEVEEVRDSGAGAGIYTVKGHAAVFNKWSLDLGGFRERVMPGAFDEVLSRDPHVLHLWDHDTSKALSSTRSKDYPLELRTDPAGLRFYSKVAPTSYSQDLRTLLEGGVIDQSSFAFIPAKDEWRIKEDDTGREVIERDIVEVAELFDVTTCAMGAYPTTDSALAVRSLASGRSLRAGPNVALLEADVEKEDASVAPGVTPQAEDESAEERKAEEAERVQALAALKDDVANRQRRIREMVNRIDRS
jgi:HK97 family phage prohead protease